MTPDRPAVRAVGDCAYVVEFAHELSLATNSRARALARQVRNLPGVVEVVPALRAVLVVIDPLTASRPDLTDRLHGLAGGVAPQTGEPSRLIEIPVVYGGDAGPDLAEVAHGCGLTAQEVIEYHSAGEYTVFMLGFAPGYPYLGILPASLRTPRLASPRLRVPAGSVAVAETLTGIYPLELPGGWRIIGRTPRALYDPRAPDPILFRPGDRARFVPVPKAAFATAPVDVPQPPTAPARPAFEVRRPGLYTTIQDTGRGGYRHLGLPASGAMDRAALHMANAIAGNGSGAAAIECAAPGPVLRALNDVIIAVTGADLAPALDGRPLPMWTPVRVRAEQMVEFGAPRGGTWAYIAVAGGVDVPFVLDSASTYVPGGLGGAGGRRLMEGDVLGCGATVARRPSALLRAGGGVVRPLEIPGGEVAVRVIPGPQDDWFTDVGLATFWGSAFNVTLRADRAGIRLAGPPVARRTPAELLSDGMLPGAIQVPPDGQPIVIMADGPTTGGYPKIGVVANCDLRLIAQARPGTTVRFVRTSVEDAVGALRALDRELRGDS